MQTAAHIIDALGGSIQVAKAIGRPIGTVSAWKTRLSIPSEYWRDLVALAKQRGVVSVNFEALADAHAAPPHSSSSSLPAVASSVR